MICPRCSREIPDDAQLCCYCGRSIVRKAPARAHQRGNGTGTAYKRGKTWTAIVTVGWHVDENGKRRQQRITKGGFKTRGEALEYCPVLLHEERDAKRKAPRLVDYWDTYRENELPKLSESKQTAYNIAWNRWKDLWYFPVDRISVADLRSAVSENAHTYYPARDMKAVMKHVFRLAAADRWVNSELPDFIVLPALEEKERITFTKDEQESLWKIYDNGDHRAALPLIMIYTGMMPGEMQNLKISMIDLEKQQIIGAGLKTKVRKRSAIYIPNLIVPVLADEIAASTSRSGYVWPHSETKFYENYYAALDAAGCRRLEPYSCRHTTATALAITENIAPNTIKKVMRWSTTKMLDRYAHPADSDAAAAVNALKR